ncbi:MAG: hypothetical protein ACRCYP_03595 [Alphaproteobacteria bacterium]
MVPKDDPLLHEARSQFPNLNWKCDGNTCTATIPTIRGGDIPLEIVVSYNPQRLAHDALVSIDGIELFLSSKRPRTTATQALSEVRSFLQGFAGMIVGAITQ